jgi:hypothetical protein
MDYFVIKRLNGNGVQNMSSVNVDENLVQVVLLDV